jgi:hypothetical protein
MAARFTRTAGNSLTRSIVLFLFLALTTAGLSACPKKQRLPAPLPDVSIGYTSFTQPTSVAELMAGFVPERQKPAGEEMLAALDRAFSEILRSRTSRSYTHAPLLPRPDHPARPSRATALDYWISVGEAANVDYLIVPQIIQIHEREGSEIGVTRPAEILMDIYLVDVKNATLVARSNYEERQVGLMENLLTLPKFLGRGGVWVTAADLAKEGMFKAVQEFGL